MSEMRKRVRGKLTKLQRARHAEVRRNVEQQRHQLDRDALDYKAQLDLLVNALQDLKREREARGLSLAEIAKRTGIDKSRLSKLENDPHPNPTVLTLTRIAAAIGVRLRLQVDAA